MVSDFSGENQTFTKNLLGGDIPNHVNTGGISSNTALFQCDIDALASVRTEIFFSVAQKLLFEGSMVAWDNFCQPGSYTLLLQ